MYEIDDKDKVIKLNDGPQSSIGAPLPVVLSDEGKVLLAFYLEEISKDWEGTSVRLIGPDSEEPAAIVEFKACYAFMFGAPNDEAFTGHPLYNRGLRPYGVYEVLDSSWVRKLEKMNSVHPNHNVERFWQRHHYIFAFHDSTFECVANGFEVTKTRGSMRSLVPQMSMKLWREQGR